MDTNKVYLDCLLPFKIWYHEDKRRQKALLKVKYCKCERLLTHKQHKTFIIYQSLLVQHEINLEPALDHGLPHGVPMVHYRKRKNTCSGKYKTKNSIFRLLWVQIWTKISHKYL